MKLIKCYVENFGKLHGYEIDFNGGLNIILEENGFGKSTFAAFLEAMLYGLDSGRGKGSDRKKYDPWQGGRFGGSLVFSIGNKTYRLERFFGKKEKEDTFKLYNNETGLESFDYSENIGIELFGIDKESFEKSVYIPQGKVEIELSGAGDINAKLSDLLERDNDLASFDEAMKLLKDKKNKYKRTGGIINKLENDKSTVEDEIKKAEELSSVEKELKEYIASKRDIKKSIEAQIEKAHLGLQKKEKLNFYKSLKNGVEKAGAKIEELEKSVKELPGEAELEEIKKAAEKYKSLLLISLSQKLSDNEESELNNLKEEIGKKIVSKEDAARIKNLFVKYYAAKDMALSGDLTEDEKKKLSYFEGIFKNSYPEDEELNDIYYKARVSSEGKKSKSGSFIPLISGGVLIFIGIILTFIIKPFLSTPIVLAGLLILFLSALSFSKNKKNKDELEKNQLEAKAFFEKYNIGYTGDIQKSVKDLKEAKEAYSELAKKKEQAEKFKENSDLTLLEDEIDNIAEKYYIYHETPEEDETPLLSLISKSEKLNSLLEKKAKYEDNEKTIKIHEEALKTLTGKYTDFAFSEAYEHLSSLITEIKIERDNFNTKSAELKSFIMENGALEEAEEFNFADIDVLKESRQALDDEIIASEKRLMDIALKTELLPELISENENLGEEISVVKKKLFLTEKTEEALMKAKENLAVKYLGPLTQNFENYKKLLSAPSDAKIDTDLNIGIIEAGEKHSSIAYSSGTRDILGLSLRFSLIESIFQKEKPTVILDDPFVNLDEQRMKEARKTLDVLAENYQILYFICHESRK